MPGFEDLPGNLKRHIGSFLPIQDAESLSQVSKAMAPIRDQVRELGLTGKASVGNRHFYTSTPPEDTRFYFEQSASGARDNFPHVTRRPEIQHTPHLTDVAQIRQDSMPNSLPPGDYPTKHRYDVGGNGRLSPAILPMNSGDKRTGTLARVDPSSGFSPQHFVAPRYKAAVDARNDVPGPGLPVKLTDRQSATGGNPQNWANQPVRFFRKP